MNCIQKIEESVLRTKLFEKWPLLSPNILADWDRYSKVRGWLWWVSEALPAIVMGYWSRSKVLSPNDMVAKLLQSGVACPDWST